MQQNGIPTSAIEAELGKILSSSTFSNAHRASGFLRFAVRQYLEGKSSELKEYVIGVEVLGRKADFDPRIDPIVRAEAKRLRTKLDEYYASTGKSDEIRICIPKGSYVPSFEPSNVAVHDTPAKETRRVSGTHRIWLASLAGLIGVATVLLWRSEAGGVPEEVRIPMPLTSYPGRVTSPSFSPDGNQVAFAWRSSEQSHSSIYTKLIGVDVPLRLTREEVDDYAPAWSPDGQSVAFLRTLSPDKDAVFVVPAIGGFARKLAEIYPTGLSDCYAWQPAWHPAGGWLAIADKEAASGPFKLFLISAETGEKRPLTSPPQSFFGDVYAAFSPDGRTLALARSSASNVSDLYLLRLSEDLKPREEPKRVTFENFYVGGPAWTPDGHAIVFSGGDFHHPGLWKIEVQPRVTKPVPLPFGTEGATLPAMSRQGHLAYAIANIDTDILRLDLAGKPPGSAKRLISSTRLDHVPRYSPDGKRIAFASNRSGSHEIWVSDSEGMNPVQLTSFGGFRYRASPRWSPDGRWIYFSFVQEDGPECWKISSEGGRAMRLNATAIASCPTGWSRDGKWMYFDRDGQVWKISGLRGAPVQVTFNGGQTAMESADGKFVYYLKARSDEMGSLWKIPASGGEESKVLESVHADNFAVTDRGIYFIPSFEQRSVEFLNLATGKIEQIASTAQRPGWGFSLSPDKRWLLYTEYEALLMHDLMLVKNFR